jgi:glycosyltransferase involved in cell wall biosynthesis
MNVAILVSGLPPDRIGGAELQAARVAQHLATRHDVTVLTRTATVPGELAAAARCTVVQRLATSVRGVRFAADVLATLRLLVARRREIDVILAYQTVIDGLIGVLAKKMLGLPVVVSVRCDTEYQLDRFPQSRWLSPFVFRHADRLLVQSPRLGAELLEVFERRPGEPSAQALRAKLAAVPNGIAAATPGAGDGRTILFIGRLTTAKGVNFLIEAMRCCPGESLTVVGDGPERHRLEELAKDLPNVRFAGAVAHADVDRLLSSARLLVQPSLQEGQPNTVMEAMAKGVPVVATRVGGVPDLVRDGVTGFLVDPGDVPALASRIRAVMSDGALWTQLSNASLLEVRRYEWPSIIEQIEAQLSAAIGAAPQP